MRAELVRFTRPETVHADPDDPRGQITSETTMESTMTTDEMFIAFQQRWVLSQVGQMPFLFPLLRDL